MKSLNDYIIESQGLTKTKLYNKIYKVTKPYTQKRYKDSAWRGVSDIKNAIESIEDGVKVSLSVKDGGYHITPSQVQMNDTTIAHAKDYEVTVTYNDIVLNGYISCMACGTVKDPWSEYDMVLVVSK